MSIGNSRTPERQYSKPLFIDRLEESGTARTLDRLTLGRTESHHDEAWLQKLIHRFPQVLPVHEIEPGFSPLVPVCLELPTPAGSADNLYVTDRGDLVIAECKLWRNPEARREVVAQIIDYAHGMASWTYADLEAAVRRASTANGDKPPSTLFQLVAEGGEIDESDFVDAVSRNLRLGRMLLLIVGDGIREGVESLSDYLQIHAGFHFTLGIVEMPVYRIPQGGFIVQPRVLARTVNIDRGIVKITDGQVTVEPPEPALGTGAAERRTSISQERLFEALAKLEPELPKALDTFIDRASDHNVFLETAPKSLQIRWRGPEDLTFALGGVDERGELITYNVGWTSDSIGRVDLAHEYLEKIASIIDASVRKTVKPAQWYVAIKGTKQPPQAIALLTRPDEWLALIEDYTEKLKAATVDTHGG